MRRRTVLRGLATTVAGLVFETTSLTQPAEASADDSSLSPAGSLSIPGATEAVVDETGTTAYLATLDGFAVVDVSDPTAPTLLAERRDLLSDRSDGPLTDVHDVSVSGDRLLVAGPDYQSDQSQVMGFGLYDVSDPSNPTRVAVHESEHAIHNAFLDGDVAYLTGTGLQDEPLVVVDVSDDEPTEIARWSVVEEDSGWEAVNPSIRACHDVVVQDDVAYVANWDAGTWLLDVSDPAAPSVITHFGGQTADDVRTSNRSALSIAFELPGNSHYVAPNEDGSIVAVGKEATDLERTADHVGGPGGIELWDLSDPTAPERILTLAARSGPWSGGTAHNFGFRGDRLYTSWYRGGVRVFDIADPARPMELDAWADPDSASFWTAKPTANGFVASSTFAPATYDQLSDDARDEPPASARLFTFPEPTESNASPAVLQEADGPSTSSEQATQSLTPGQTLTVSKADGTTAETPTPASTTSPGQPGFGALVSLAGLGISIRRVIRRRR